MTATTRADAGRTKQLREQIRAAGLRATQPRLLVLGYLADSGRPVTHADAAEALEENGLDRATVYRNLVDLAAAGIARRADFGDHVWRFELASETQEHEHSGTHVHFVCKSCGSVACLPDDTVRIMPGRDTPRALQTDVEVNISGVCDACCS